jgi:hypothetical protein
MEKHSTLLRCRTRGHNDALLAQQLQLQLGDGEVHVMVIWTAAKLGSQHLLVS